MDNDSDNDEQMNNSNDFQIRLKKVDSQEFSSTDPTNTSKNMRWERWRKLFTTGYVVINLNNQYYQIIFYGLTDPNKNYESHNTYIEHNIMQSKKEAMIDWWLIDPNGDFYKYFSVIIVILLMYTISIMPFNLAFNDSYPNFSTMWWVELSMDLIFCIDVIINFFLPYQNEDGTLITNHKTIILEYMKGWFLIDVASSFPFNLIEVFVDNEEGSLDSLNNSTLLKILRLPRIWKLFKLVKLMKIFRVAITNPTVNEIVEYIKVQDWIYSLCNFCCFIMLFVHLFSCLWMVGTMLSLPTDLNTIDFENTRSWVLEKMLIRLENNEVVKADNFKLYLACLYWAFTTLTTVGYGDIAPYSMVEKIICIVWILFGVALFSYVIGTLTSVIENTENNGRYLSRKLNRVETFANEINFSQNFRKKIRRAIEYNSEQTNYFWFKQHQIYDELHDDHKYELCKSIHYGIIFKLHFFFDKSKEFIIDYAIHLYPMHIDAFKSLYEYNEETHHVYFITNGRFAYTIQDPIIAMQAVKSQSLFKSDSVDLDLDELNQSANLMAKRKSYKAYLTVINGSTIGEVETILPSRRLTTVMAEVDSHTFYMESHVFKSIRHKFREYWTDLLELAAEKKYKLYMHQFNCLVKMYKSNKKSKIEAEAIALKADYNLDKTMDETLLRMKQRDQIRICRRKLEKAYNSKKRLWYQISCMNNLYKNKQRKFKDEEDNVSLENSLEIQDFKGFKFMNRKVISDSKEFENKVHKVFYKKKDLERPLAACVENLNNFIGRNEEKMVKKANKRGSMPTNSNSEYMKVAREAFTEVTKTI